MYEGNALSRVKEHNNYLPNELTIKGLVVGNVIITMTFKEKKYNNYVQKQRSCSKLNTTFICKHLSLKI